MSDARLRPGPVTRVLISGLARALLSATALAAQGPTTGDSLAVPANTVHRLSYFEIGEFPFDRVADGLGYLPGVVTLNDGSLSIRGGDPDGVAAYVDGVPVTPGHRQHGASLLGGSYYGTPGSGIGIGTNAVQDIRVHSGAFPAHFGNAESGVLEVMTLGAPRRWTATGGYEGDSPFGSIHTLGLNRFQLQGGGPLGSRVGVVAAAVLEGQSSERLGIEQNRSPIFLQSGIDTTVSVTSGGNTTLVDVYRFTPSAGIRIPASAQSAYQLLGKVSYSTGEYSRLAVLALASQEQHRSFDYLNFYNAPQLGGVRSWSRVYALSWAGRLNRSEERPVEVEANLSYQSDHRNSGPLNTLNELDTRDPWAGLIVKPFDFRFSPENFPIDDQLVANWRNNLPGTRRTPYDLENADQYVARSEWRANPYSVFGATAFTTGGGPDGLIEFDKESRVLGRVKGSWRPAPAVTLTLGGEAAHFDLSHYSSLLVNQSVSDVYLGSPSRAVLFAEARIGLQGLSIEPGLRYQRFSADATRPFLLDTVSLFNGQPSPTYGTYAYFPRISTWGYGGTAVINGRTLPLVDLRRDKSHSRLSPGLRVSYALSRRTTLRAGASEQAQAPDFHLIYTGSNIDIQTTNPSHFFGGDLDFIRTRTLEAGVRQSLGQDVVLDASVYDAEHRSGIAGQLLSIFDPVKKQANDIRVITNGARASTFGVDLGIEGRLGPAIRGRLSYSYQKATVDVSCGGFPSCSAPTIPSSLSRPHTLAGMVALIVPDTWKAGSVPGTLLRGVAAYATLRFASGTPYTVCPAVAGNEDVLSGSSTCVGSLAGTANGTRLSALKLVDLRVEKGLDWAGHRLSIFADARNLLNLRSVIQVFSVTGTTTSATSRVIHFAADSADFAKEAEQNGVYGVLGNPTSIDLSFGGAGNPQASCGSWVDQAGNPSAPNCIYLIQTEERFGNGDHIFDLNEQRRASGALYDVFFGLQNFTLPGRRVRIGVELSL